jgi:energy-coupling factor transporter ATP-binding protein EcfA2
MPNISKLVRISLRNIGCIGAEGLIVDLDNVVCLVGKNNSGKSTVLRAYALAHGAETFSAERDRCQFSQEDAISEVELEVHIPAGIGNVDEKWKKVEGDLLIVRSRWQWAAPEFKTVRSTWDPDADGWAPDGKAGGADNVFKSRLPKPLRIGSLQDTETTEKALVTLALSPLMAALETERQKAGSALATALGDVITQVNALGTAHEQHFNEIATKVTDGFKSVFPRLDVRLNVTTGPWTPKIDSLVKDGSGLRVKDGKSDTALNQQGTGARRALFWAMLQVHNELTRDKEARDAYRKVINTDLKKKGIDAAKVEELKALLAAIDEGGAIPQDGDDPAFPGYLLLIDEPENALHPMAARAAQRHLYKLAESADWQVMMTTHSPYFINPLEDHTTIIRLERGDDDDAPISPKTYRSDDIVFEGDDKLRLQALQHVDPGLAEIFFGSYPVLVEGDTEHAAFIASILEKQHELMDKVTVVKSRGKAILPSLIAIMEHFKIDFGIVHDCDPPFTKHGNHNGMWTQNSRIRDAIKKARKAGITVRHRVSIPDFERFLGYDEESKDKPLTAYLSITKDDALSVKVQALLTALVSSDQHEPFSDDEMSADADYLNVLRVPLMAWAAENKLQDKLRFKGKD